MKILLVDDDLFTRGVLEQTLERAGYSVTAACDGIEAMEKAEKDQFDLLITDLFMPKKEGLEVIQEIKAAYPAMKILAMSSDGFAGHSTFLKIAEAVGSDDCLKKPFNAAQFLEKVGMVLCSKVSPVSDMKGG